MKFVTSDQMRRENPELYEEMQERMAQQKKLSGNRPSATCLDCDNPNLVFGSRYCQKHYLVYSKLEKRDVRSGRVKDKNYAYSEKGFNNGMNVYVRDKEHFKELAKKFKKTEHLEQY